MGSINQRNGYEAIEAIDSNIIKEDVCVEEENSQNGQC